MPILYASYSCTTAFRLPENVFLLPVDENKRAKEGVYGSWWIKWDNLHYYDKDGKEIIMENSDVFETDYKRPAETEIDFDEHEEVESDDEDDKEESK